jgi:exonuclease VII large subunit
MKVNSRQHRRQHRHHPLPNRKPAVRIAGADIVDDRNSKAERENRRHQNREDRLVRSLDDVNPPAKLELVYAVLQSHAGAELLRQAVAEQSASGGAVRCMLTEVLVEGLRRHWWQGCERAFVVVVAIFDDFGVRR